MQWLLPHIDTTVGCASLLLLFFFLSSFHLLASCTAEAPLSAAALGLWQVAWVQAATTIAFHPAGSYRLAGCRVLPKATWYFLISSSLSPTAYLAYKGRLWSESYFKTHTWSCEELGMGNEGKRTAREVLESRSAWVWCGKIKWAVACLARKGVCLGGGWTAAWQETTAQPCSTSPQHTVYL